MLGQKLETGRVQLRHIREKIREDIISAEKKKEISEDDRYKAQEDLDELVQKYQNQIHDLGTKKEAEISAV